MVGITDVPSVETRGAVTEGMRPFLAAFPVPTGAAKPDGFAEFAASFANPARHDVGSVRIDHMPNADTSIRGRYSFADFEADQRGANGFSLNTINRIRSRAQTITGSLDRFLSPTKALALNANYSRLRVDGSYSLDAFGGAAVPDFSSTIDYEQKQLTTLLRFRLEY